MTGTGPLHVPTENVIHAFRGGADGASPADGLIVVDGMLYGTTVGDNCGTVFKLAPARLAGGTWTKTVLHQFAPGGDGCSPYASLLRLGNDLYGTTRGGGTYVAGGGTVFRLKPPNVAGGAWTETVLHSFPVITGVDASLPTAGLIDMAGTLYGTTPWGGAHFGGAVFALTPPATARAAWAESVLYSFKGNDTAPNGDGGFPESPLLRFAGTLYGTASGGGVYGNGAVFSLVPPVAGGAWTDKLLYNFPNGNDGAIPGGTLLDIRGTLYGTTKFGGTSGDGTVFALTPPRVAGGSWTETVLHSFDGADGNLPWAGRLLELRGKLYGTTMEGGSANLGTVFSLTPPVIAGGTWTEKVLHSFLGGSDGRNPESGLVEIAGTLYGTTPFGGSGCSATVSQYGCGMVFAITP